ncbi:lipid II flippase MurJ, partial [Escherichia marmotae]|nr:lipid II flippase MurJ [Escherichia marmotae]
YLFIFSVSNLLFIVLIQLITLIKIGPSSDTDALFAGMTIPSVILSVLVSSLTNVLVPLFVSSKCVLKDLWEQVYLFSIGSAFIVLPLALFSPLWLGYVFSGFDGKTLSLAQHIISVQFIVIPFSIASAIFTAFFNANSKFISAEAIPAICSLIVFPFVFPAITSYGVLAVSYIYAAKIFLTFVIQILKIGGPVKLSFNDIDIKGSFSRIKYLILGSVYYKSGPIIDRHILSYSVAGALSLFVLVQQLLSMANLIFTKTIIIPDITMMNKLAVRENKIFKYWLMKKVFILIALTLFLYFLFFISGKQIITFVLQMVNLQKFDPHTIWWLTMALFGGFIGDFIATLVSSSFYSKGDTKTPSCLSIVTFTIFIPFKFISYHYAGIYGLAFASSAYSLINMSAMFLIIILRLK